MSSLIRYILPLLLLFGGCSDRGGEGDGDASLPLSNTSLATLRTLAVGGCFRIDREIVCEGRVTTTTAEGNFYRTLFVEDESGGVEILLGLYDADATYPEGLYVVLQLYGTAVMVKNGVVQVGLPPTSYDDEPREMESQVVIDKHILRGDSVVPIEPKRCGIEELSESMCGTLVCVSGLRYAPIVEDEKSLLSGMCRFVDSEGAMLYSYVSEYANFATEPIPDGEVAICGILSYEYVGEVSQHYFVVTPRRLSDYFMVANTSTSSFQNLSTVEISKRSSGE